MPNTRRKDLGFEAFTGQPLAGGPRCYRIVRFYRDGRKARTMKTGLSLGEAQAHCKREDTHGDGWFDGYDTMRGVR
jgi:hypothetical protein